MASANPQDLEWIKGKGQVPTPGNPLGLCDRFFLKTTDVAGLLDGSTPESQKKHLVVDVRDEEEFAAGHVKGAVNIPSGTFESNALSALDGKLDGVETIVVHCQLSQKRGPTAAKKLVDLLAASDLEKKPKVKIMANGYEEFLEKFGDKDLIEKS